MSIFCQHQPIGGPAELEAPPVERGTAKKLLVLLRQGLVARRESYPEGCRDQTLTFTIGRS
ncbi:hypothetical protein [Fodinibius halophilus]|uniref:hypothetical protein n=1 Tax=Fodinibius halophilus TaxID=1736908 RepID=UPI00197AAA94|nr:hypothetical protein [Fodinibius halophilus]